ncbi:hypothetical protein [uncultured Dokdonia sp.]|uniref:hypothetical protein n=1 Tax=uncultured Dokdonia sp. TaxID=575653 RepID=UPI002632B1DD|nr:hypothetical protein [uncultured Dokdonia sp.]
MKIIVFIISLFYLGACHQDETTTVSEVTVAEDPASVVSVTASQSGDAYVFNVGISSPDKGCDQYANWWEIVSEDGFLIYRRILAHSHVNEQPFVRSGSVTLVPTQEVIIRVHMNTTGYSTKGYRGSVANGFSEYTIPEGFANELVDQAPLPNGCTF